MKILNFKSFCENNAMMPVNLDCPGCGNSIDIKGYNYLDFPIPCPACEDTVDYPWDYPWKTNSWRWS